MSHMLSTLHEPLYILEEFISTEAINLRVKHHGKGGFSFSERAKGAAPEVKLTADSKTGLTAPRRLIKDSTGKVILELWRNAVGDESYISHPLPGSLALAVVAPRATISKDKVDIYVKKDNDEIKLELRGQDIWKRNTLVYHGNDLVMQMRFVNYITTYVPFSGNQWDVAVAQGFDLSLACAIVVYMGSTLYDSSKFRSSYGLESTDDRDNKRISRKWNIPAGVAKGAMLGAAAGGASA